MVNKLVENRNHSDVNVTTAAVPAYIVTANNRTVLLIFDKLTHRISISMRERRFKFQFKKSKLFFPAQYLSVRLFFH